MVGLVLAAQSDLGCPGPYIPTFYQLKEILHVHPCESSKVNIHVQCSMMLEFLELTVFNPQNAMMQQPLAHLYFLTVFELLQTKKYRPIHLARLAGKITGVGDYKSINFFNTESNFACIF